MSLGGNLYVNAGQIGVTDILNQTFSMRMGSLATMNAPAGLNAIAIGSAQTATGDGGSTVATSASGDDAIAIGSAASASEDGAIAFGLNAAAGSANSVALGANSVTASAVETSEIDINGATYAFAGTAPASTVSIGDEGEERTLTNLAAGRVSAASTDAVNGSQLFAATEAVETVGTGLANTAAALGGGASYDPETGTFTGPTYTVGDGSALTGGSDTIAVTGVEDAISNLDSRTTLNETVNAGLVSGTFGLVQQADPDADVTVSAERGGSTVDFTGTDGTRVLTGVTSGDVSDSSTDAVNGSQLFTTNQGLSSTAAALGGGASYDAATGAFTGPTYTVGNGAGGTTDVTTVEGAISNLDGRTASNETAIGDLSDAVNSGTIGLVQQADPDADVTVAAATGGTVVDFTGTDGERVLTGVADGEVSAASSEAVNGSQLFTTNQGLSSTAAALGGGASYNAATGVFTGPSYSIGGNTFGDVGSAFVQTDTILGNQGSSLATALGGGTSYDEETGVFSGPTYTVGDGAGGTTDVTSVGGAISNLDGRTASNEAAIGDLSDAVNSGALGLVQQAGPTADVTVAATTGGAVVDLTGTDGARVLSGVAAGDVSAGSTEAINGGQAFGIAQSVAQGLGGGAAVNGDGSISAPSYTIGSNTLGSVGDAFTAVDSNLTSLNDAVNRIDDNFAIGTASGADAVAAGANSLASGSESVAVGQGATAEGDAAVALGNDAVAGGTGSVALGDGASATEDNSVALGAGSTTDPVVATTGTTIRGTNYAFAGGTAVGTVSVGSAGAERTVTNVAAGRISATSTDAVNGSQLHATNQAINTLESGLDEFNEYGVQYDRNADGSRANSLTLAGGDPNAPVVLANVATGTADHHAANVGQVNAGLQNTLTTARSYTDTQVTEAVGTANAYTDQVATDTLGRANAYADQRLGQLSGDIAGVRSEAHYAAAIGLAASSLRFDDRPGKLSVAMGGGTWRGRGALAVGMGFTSENQRLRSNLSASTAGGKWGVGAGVTFTID